MNNYVDGILDPWMLTVHGNKHSESPILRLTTLVYCMSLPKEVLNKITGSGNGSTTIDVHLMTRVPGDSPDIENPSNMLEQLLSDTDGSLVHRVSIPLEYNKKNHIQGSGIFKSFSTKCLGCETQVTSTKDMRLKFELLHLQSKRYISFTMSS
jgi:hypothetical protein